MAEGEELSNVLNLLVETALISFVISVAVGLNGLSLKYGEIRSNQVVSTMNVQEYRRYHKFDNKPCSPSDVVAIVMQERGSIGVTVNTLNLSNSLVTTLKWDKTTTSTMYDIAAIQHVLPLACVYTAQLVRDGSGTLVGITFNGSVSN